MVYSPPRHVFEMIALAIPGQQQQQQQIQIQKQQQQLLFSTRITISVWIFQWFRH